MKHAFSFQNALLAIVLLAASCSGDRPTDSTEQRSSIEAARSGGVVKSCGTPYTWNVFNVSDFDSAWTNLCDGDIIHVAANTTLAFNSPPSPACSGLARFCAINSSFTIEGVDSTSKIVVTNTGGYRFLYALDNGNDGAHTVTIRNIKLQRDHDDNNDLTETFLSISGYDHVVIDNVIMDLIGQTVVFNCKTLDIDGLDYEGSGTFEPSATGSALDGFTHTIQNSKFRKTTASAGLVQANFSNSVDGSILWENNVISSTGGANTRWYSITGAPGNVAVEMTNNDFKKRVVQLGGTSGTVTFDMNCNNSNLHMCPDSLFTHTGGNAIEYPIPSPSWTFDYGTCISDFSLGSVANQTAAVYDGIAYVKFTVGHTNGAEPAMHVFVRWGDDDCATGTQDVAATWNQATGKYWAAFDLDGIDDGLFYWQPRVSLCTTTVTGTCSSHTTNQSGSGTHYTFTSE